MAELAVDSQNALWAAAPGTGDGGLLGIKATSLVGFYGATPVARPVIPATPDAQDIADALVALGLVTQAV